MQRFGYDKFKGFNLTTSSAAVPSLSQSFVYNSDNLTTNITQGTSTLSLLYGPDGQRIRTIQAENGVTQKTKYFSSNYEKEVIGSTTRELNYIYCPYGLVALIIKQGTTQTTYYAETDNQGSIIGLLNNNGTYAEKYSYDAWGRRRNPTDWSFNNVTLPTIIDRGYTGHEHLDKFGIINMNGRMYDPYLGRF